MAETQERSCERCGSFAIELDAWEAAYNELRRDHARLQWKYSKVLFALEHAHTAINNDILIADWNKF